MELKILLDLQEQFIRFIRGIPGYARKEMRSDAFAGLTIAIMGVPQAMAYALIADLPPVYGLYTSMVTCAVAAVLGSSNHLVTGPTNALCMVIISLTAHLPAKYDVSLVEVVFLLTFLTGLLQLAFGLLRLGGIIRYVSNSVIVGFTAGAGILIAFNQLKNVMGVTISAHAERFYLVVIETLSKIPEINPYSFGVGLTTALIIVIISKINKRLPSALIGILVTGLITWFFGWHDPAMGELQVQIVKDISPISASFDFFRIPQLIIHPNYELTRELGTGVVAVALLGLIEAASISRAVSSQSGQRLNFTREFVGQGAGNLIGSFFSCFAGSGSFTRTAVCYKSGGKTRMAAVFSAIWTGLTIILFADFANYIPKSALAGLLVVIAYSMVDKRRLMVTWKSGKNSRLTLGVTMASTLILPLEYAIFVGIFLSIVLLLKVTGKTDLTQLMPRADYGFDEVPYNRAAASPVVIVNMEGDLYFAAVEDLDYELLRCLTPETRVVVLRMKRLRAVGSTAMAILEHFYELLKGRNITLVVSGIEDELIEIMTGSGLRKEIGEQNIFYADNKLFQSTELAMARAWSIVQRDDVTGEGKKSRDAIEPCGLSITAGDLMTRKCIRFGNQHQLREAIWLMSEMHKRSTSLSASPLFLQDIDGKLFGKLNTWQIISTLAGAIEKTEVDELTNEQLAQLLREPFTTSIKTIARSNLTSHSESACLGELLVSSVHEDLEVIPVCDNEGRIMGMVDQQHLLQGVNKLIKTFEGPEHG